MTIIAPLLTNILVAKNMLDPSVKAYCMDGEDFKRNGRIDPADDLRQIVGLGTCGCCDYFYPFDNCVVLVEETRLATTIDDMVNTYQSHENINEIIIREIRQENCLKVYGSLLVLCWLTHQCATVKEKITGKPYKFFLIFSDIDSSDQKLSDNLMTRINGIKSSIKNALRGNLKIMKDVIVCTPNEFKQKFTLLKSQQTTP